MSTSVLQRPVPPVAPSAGDRREPEPGLRIVCILALLGIALVHLLDLPGTIGSDPVQGTLYLVLMAACGAAAFMLLHTVSRVAWLCAGVIAAVTAAAYVLTRTVGLPFDHSDIGNWGDPLGIASLFVEGVVVVAAGYGIWLGRRRVTPA